MFKNKIFIVNNPFNNKKNECKHLNDNFVSKQRWWPQELLYTFDESFWDHQA